MATARATKNATKSMILRAGTLITAMESETDGARFADYNTEFHSVIEEAGTSPKLAVILANVRALSALYVTRSLLVEPDRRRAANAEHAQILRAIIDRDPEAAADAVLRHLDGTLRALLQVRATGSLPTEAPPRRERRERAEASAAPVDVPTGRRFPAWHRADRAQRGVWRGSQAEFGAEGNRVWRGRLYSRAAVALFPLGGEQPLQQDHLGVVEVRGDRQPAHPLPGHGQ